MVNVGRVGPRTILAETVPTERSAPAATTGSTGLDHARGTAFNAWSDSNASVERLRVGGFGSALTNAANRVDFRWKPGATIPFGVGLDLTNAGKRQPPRDVRVELWTNADSADPKKWRGVPMVASRPNDRHDLAYTVDLPVQRAGTYKATVRMSVDGGPWKYGSEVGASDLTFRTRPIEFEKMNMKQVVIGMANAPEGTARFSTIEDMLDPKWGSYNLETMKAQGVNTVYIECPFRADPWDRRHPADVAGSLFAVTDYFTIDPRISREASKMPDWDRDGQAKVANAAMKKLTDKAHANGMKVVFGVAPNHVGHNYIFRDMFESPTKGLEVVRNNFSQIAVNPGQLAAVEKKLSDPSVKQYEKDFAEYLFPSMYARRDANPEGASNVNETMSEWWYGDWSDIKKLNHGGFMAYGIHDARSPQNEKVLDWIGRWMTHAVVNLGADGFRIDHGTGMPDQFFEETLTKVQAQAEKHGHEGPIFMMAEDHDRKQWIGNRVDYIQSKWWETLIDADKASDPGRFFSVFENPYFNELLQADNHDEIRAEKHFHGDLKGLGRFIATTMLAGGPFSMLMGTEYGESQQLAFKVGGGIPTLWQARDGKLMDANLALNKLVSKAGKLKSEHPAIQTRTMHRLHASEGGGRTVAYVKHPESESDNRVLVFSNLAKHDPDGGRFKLDDATASWIFKRDNAANGQARFQVRDLLSDEPTKNLWSAPKTAAELTGHGVAALLAPYQVQALELVQV